jgi:hypothetical protein
MIAPHEGRGGAMTIRSAWFVVGAAMGAGCNGQEIHAGSNAAGAAASPTGVSSTSGSEEGGAVEGGGLAQGEDATTGGGSVQNGEGGSNLSSTVGIRTCASGSPSTAAPNGHTAIAPIECSEAQGPAHPVASAADVASLLPGTWSGCAGLVFGLPVPTALGVELTSDGQYHLLGGAPDSSLLALDSLPAVVVDGGSDAGPNFDGTYQVIDGSASYGPGTYELELRPASGGLFLGQIVVTDSPRQLQYLEPNASPQTLSPAAPWSPTAGSCSCSQPAGFAAVTPTECDEVPGSAHPVASAADVASLLPGTWSGCDGPAFGIVPNTAGEQQGSLEASSVELTADGQYHLLGAGPDGSLVSFDPPVDSEGGVDPVVPGSILDGTYAVVDGSATYGPGTFELQLLPATGGLFSGQVLVTDSPRQIQYLAPNVSPQTLAPSYPWTVRAGLCSCLDAKGTKVSESDPLGLAAAMTGRWLWCGNEPVFPAPPYPPPADVPYIPLGPVMGIEFSNDGRWYVLGVDPSGTIGSGTPASPGGVFQIGVFPLLPPLGAFLRAEPLEIELVSSTTTYYGQVIVTQNPRAMLLTTFPDTSSYSIFFPLP